MNNSPGNLKNIYLLMRTLSAPRLFGDHDPEEMTDSVSPEHYVIAAMVPRKELVRITDIYEMYRKDYSGLWRRPEAGDILCGDPHVGMLVVPGDFYRGEESCVTTRMLIELDKVPTRGYAIA